MKPIELPKTIKGDRVTLKKLEVKQAAQIFEYVNKDRKKLRVYLPWVDKVKSVKDELNFIKDSLKRWKKKEIFNYGIFINKTNTYIGNIGVHDIIWPHNGCSIGYWLLSTFEGNGYMSAAVTNLEKTLFKKGFNRLVVMTDTTNLKSQNVPKRLGYHLDGILRQSKFEHGKYTDHMVWSKLKSDLKLKKDPS